MINKTSIILLIVISFFTTLFSQDKIIISNIHGTIDLGLVPYVEKSISIAEEKNAAYILFDINTFGGRIDAATQIKDAILNSKVPTIAFINKRAISAGALISLSCKKIVMTEGASIGAATAVDIKGEKASEKVQSFMRAEMATIAETNGRDKRIAEAMVDEDIEIEGVIEKGKLLTLTSEKAKELNIADLIANSHEALFDSLEIKNADIEEIESSWAEKLVRFLTNPIVASMLLTLGGIGLLFEIKSPGWGIPGTFGVIFLALFFGSHYIVNLASAIEIGLVVGGIVLIMLEIFVIPGFGVAGILGFISLSVGLFLSLLGRWETVDSSMIYSAASYLFIVITISAIALLVFLFKLHDVPFWKKVGLQKTFKSEDGYNMETVDTALNGKKGKSITYLRPSGFVEIDGNRYNAQSSGEFIPKGKSVIVHKVEGNRLYVKKC